MRKEAMERLWAEEQQDLTLTGQNLPLFWEESVEKGRKKETSYEVTAMIQTKEGGLDYSAQ